jgi:hypothetical protein
MTSETGPEPPTPDDVHTSAELVSALRRLRVWSGLTYRQLEAEARNRGEVLPSSTIATALGRPTLPREQVVAALARACGLDEDQVRAWLAARTRIAVANEGAGPPALRDEEVPARRVPRRAVVGLVVIAVIGLAAAGYLAVWPAPERGDGKTAGTRPNLLVEPGGTEVRIKAARAPGECLSEGHEPTGRKPDVVAVLRACDGATPPATYLKPVGGNQYFIQWRHPVHGTGCLTTIGPGPFEGLLEPRNSCESDNGEQVFEIEPAGSGHYRLRLSGDACVTVREQVAKVHPCTEAADEEFVVDF